MKTYMKIFCGFLLLTVVSYSHALPATTVATPKLAKVNLEKDVEEFPVRQFPFDGFLGGFNEMFERMRQQMLYLMSQIPRIGLGNTPEGGNTTSVTKVIDGHKVVINETVYTNGNGENAAAVFKVRVVDIRPDSKELGDGGEATDTPATPAIPADRKQPKGSVESVEQSIENEIGANTRSVQQKRKIHTKNIMAEPNYENIESFDDYPSNNYNNLETFDDVDNNIENYGDDNIETFEENPISNNEFDSDNEEGPVYDLSNDIRINKIAEMMGKEPNPDAELIFHPQSPARDLSRDTYVNELAEKFGRMPNPDAEVFTPIRNAPIAIAHDLERDTYVNEIGNLPLNPDSEFIDNSPRSRYYYKTDNS